MDKHKMISHRIRHTLWLAAAALVFPQRFYAQTQWIEDGMHVASTTTLQVHLSGVPDGNGGTFIAYEKNPSGDSDIYAQWIDQRGNLRWGLSGILVCSSGMDQKHPSIAGDGSGGVYIAWQDESDNNLYAQHLDASGSPLGPSGGFLVCSAPGEQTQVKMASDGSGGIILVWQDLRNGSTNDIYAQRIDGSGNPMWAVNGVPVTTASGNQSSHVIRADDAGNVVIAWQDYRNGYSNIDIYAQKILSNGTQAWNTNGKPVASLSGNQYSPAMDTSNNKIIISWQDSRFDNGNIYAQAMDSNGTILWTADGIPICQATGTQNNSRVVHDDSGGAFIAWVDNRSYYDIYAQHIDENGTILWASNGIPVNASSGLQYAPELVSDGAGGVLCIWNDNRTEENIDLYAQHMNSGGSLYLAQEGLPVVNADSTQQNHIILSDGSGGAITLWQDSRSGRKDIYAQLLNDNIQILVPAPDTLWTGSQTHTIEWTHHTTETLFDHLMLRASVSPGDGFPIIISQNSNPAEVSQNWTPNGVNSTSVQIKIQAQDALDSLLCEYISPVFSVDSQAPEPFSLISPADGEKTPPAATFQWEASTDAVSGLDHYELWIDDAPYLDNLYTASVTLNEAQKLTEGYHTWTIKAVDRAGYIRPANTSRQIQAYTDNDPPDPFSLLTPANTLWTTQAAPQFAWSASADAGSGLAKYQFYLDGQLEIDDIPPSIRQVNSVTLTAGSHTWYVTAMDSLDNTRSSATWTVHLDNIGPQTFNITDPDDNQWLSDTTPAFTWEAASDTGIGLAEYQLWIDDMLKRDHISGQLTTITLSAGEALEQGSHTWFVTAKDSLENERTSQSTFTVGIDTTAPSEFTLTLPVHDLFINTQTPNFSWNASADAVSGLLKYQLWIDGALNRDNLSATTASPAAALPEGIHTWFVKAVDSAGNSRIASTSAFTIDITPPEMFALTAPLPNEVLHTSRPVFSWHGTQDMLSGFRKFQFFVNGQSVIDSLSAQDTTLTLAAPFSNSTYSWKVWAWDNAGNYRISTQIPFTIDCHPPDITSPAAASAAEDVFFTYTAEASDADGDDVTFAFYNYPSWLTPDGNRISGTPVEGVQDSSFLITAFDGSYYDSLEVAVDVLPVNDPPALSEIPSQTIDEDSMLAAVPFSIQDEETPAANLLLSGSSADTSLVFNGSIVFGGSGENRNVTITPNENAFGTTVITVQCSDGATAVERLFTLTVNAVNDPPTLSSLSDQTVNEDSALTAIPILIGDVETSAAQLILSGTLSDTSFVSENQLLFGGQDQNRTLTITPKPDRSGEAVVTISVTDGEAMTSTSFLLTVEPVNDPPVITSPGTATATEDEAFVYQASATDIDGPGLSLQFQNYPGWLSPSGPEISGTPPNGSQNTVFRLIASDGILTDTLDVHLTVVPVNDPPCFDYPFPELVFNDTDTLNLQIDLDEYASDPDDPDSTLAWSFKSIEHASIAITIDSVSHFATFSGVNYISTNHIVFTVSDPQGAWAADTLTINMLQTGIEENPAVDLPRVFVLSNNYPNPFNPVTAIQYSVPKFCHVILCIYNIMGQKLETLVDAKKAAGTYEVHWNASDCPSGIYIYRMQADTYQSIKRMVLLK